MSTLVGHIAAPNKIVLLVSEEEEKRSWEALQVQAIGYKHSRTWHSGGGHGRVKRKLDPRLVSSQWEARRAKGAERSSLGRRPYKNRKHTSRPYVTGLVEIFQAEAMERLFKQHDRNDQNY